MSKNRKAQSAALRFGPAVKAVVLVLLIGGSAVGYVWQKDQIGRLGQEMKSREVRLNKFEEQNEQLRKQLATMQRPQFLEMKIQELKLGLVAPQPGQVWRLTESGLDAKAPLPEHQYAARDNGPILP